MTSLPWDTLANGCVFAFRWGVNWKWANEMIRQIGWRREGVKEEKNGSKRQETGEGKRRKRDKKHFRRREPVGGIGGKAKEIHKENRGREHMERARRLLRKGKGRRRGEQATSFANSSPHTFPPTPSTSLSSSTSPWKFQEFVRFDKDAMLLLATCNLWLIQTYKEVNVTLTEPRSSEGFAIGRRRDMIVPAELWCQDQDQTKDRDLNSTTNDWYRTQILTVFFQIPPSFYVKTLNYSFPGFKKILTSNYVD